MDVNYEDDYFQYSGNGKTRLRRILKYNLGFIPATNLEEEDLPHLNNAANFNNQGVEV